MSIPVEDLDEALGFFTSRLGFRLEVIFPADDPATALLSSGDDWVQLRRGDGGPPPGSIPEAAASFAVNRVADGDWVVGRAGMRYRDLLPGRQGGRFIASHIHVPGAGPVPDYVHHHRIRFQMIFCHRGWVRLVYEDQGEPFVMYAGDCVLQPPGIRHRVLESGDDLHVVEVGCPAAHETRVDHVMALPNGLEPDRDFEGQRFVLHRAATASMSIAHLAGFSSREVGILGATDGLAAAWVHRSLPDSPIPTPVSHAGELDLFVMLSGSLLLVGAGGRFELAEGDSFSLAVGGHDVITAGTDGCELLEVRLPG